MCLFIKPGCKIEIAKEPISVFKLVFKVSEKEWKSYVRKTIHDYNKELKTVDHLTSIKLFDSDSYIEEGFHSCVNKKAISHCISNLIRYYTYHIIKNLEVVSATIPEGTEYCLGSSGDIVSNKIIVHKPEINIKVISEQKIVWIAAEKESDSCAKDWATGELFPYSKLQEKPDFKSENVLYRDNELDLDIKKKTSSYFHVFKDNKASMKLLPALIPQGAKYCLGNNNDVFTNKLIVFRNEPSLKRYLGISWPSKFSSDIRIAEKPIPVFKIVRKIDDTEWEGVYQRTVYKFNDTLKACKHLSLDNKSGFYAYTNQELAREELTDMFSRILGIEVAECIIPEGSEYRLGENKEIVSNRIIVFENKEKFEEYLKTH
jgi:hypothetical protein